VPKDLSKAKAPKAPTKQAANDAKAKPAAVARKGASNGTSKKAA
jgi:hypothetical protein